MLVSGGCQLYGMSWHTEKLVAESKLHQKIYLAVFSEGNADDFFLFSPSMVFCVIYFWLKDLKSNARRCMLAGFHTLCHYTLFCSM